MASVVLAQPAVSEAVRSLKFCRSSAPLSATSSMPGRPCRPASMPAGAWTGGCGACTRAGCSAAAWCGAESHVVQRALAGTSFSARCLCQA